MKKTNLFLTLAAAVIMTTGTGCTVDLDSIPEELIPQINVSVPKEDTTEPEVSDAAASGVPSVIVTSASPEKTTSSVQNNVSAVEPVTVPDDMEDFDIQKTAWKLYENAENVYFGLVYTRSYFTATNNVTGDMFYEIADERVKTVADVKKEVRRVFAESLASQYDAVIDEAYKEYNGKLYELQNGKGGDVNFENVELVLVSSDENKAEFNAVAHYSGYSDITRKFTIVRENDMWKVSEFTNPTSEPHEGSVATPTESAVSEPDKAEMEELASELYTEGMSRYFQIVINGSYGEAGSSYIVNDYGTVFYEMIDPAITSIKELEDIMGEYFTESCVAQMRDNMAWHYIEKDGKVYRCIANKGGVFDKFDFNFERVEGDKAYFSVTVYTPDNRVLDTAPLVLTKENNNWKISEYTYY